MAPGGPEQVPGWFMMPMGGAGQPMSDLDLRFPMMLAPDIHVPMSLSLGACAVKRSHGMIDVPL